MAGRVATHLPRLVVLGVAFLLAGAALTYGAAKRLSAVNASKVAPHATTPTVVVPDVVGQAFTFAKGTLEDDGFAWEVNGNVQGYAVNTVATQTPRAGTKLKDTGAPTITLVLARSSYAESGEPEDVSPYIGTAVEPVVQPAAQRLPTTVPSTEKSALPQSTTAAPPTTAKPSTAAKPTTPAKPAASPRPPAFIVAGAPKEPLKEMPLTQRATDLSRWLSTHTTPTNAAVHHFLYQNAWVVTGAKFGWWHGARALKLLIAADQKAERIWGIGSKSELDARHALTVVAKKSR